MISTFCPPCYPKLHTGTSNIFFFPIFIFTGVELQLFDSHQLTAALALSFNSQPQIVCAFPLYAIFLSQCVPQAGTAQTFLQPWEVN